MAATREQIIAALLTRLSNICGATFKAYDRRFFFYDDLVAMIQSPGAGAPPPFPFISVYDGVGFGGGVTTWEQRGKGLPAVRTWDITLVIYARKSGAGTPGGPLATPAGSSFLTPLIESVELAFVSDDPSANALTLVSVLGQANKVSHCWLQGAGHTIPGDIDPSGLAMQTIPVRIMIP